MEYKKGNIGKGILHLMIPKHIEIAITLHLKQNMEYDIDILVQSPYSSFWYFIAGI